MLALHSTASSEYGGTKVNTGKNSVENHSIERYSVALLFCGTILLTAQEIRPTLSFFLSLSFSAMVTVY